MSQTRKQLKVVSFAQFVIALLALGMGLRLVLGGVDVPEGDYTLIAFTVSSATLVMLTGVLLIFVGLLGLYATMLGVRGANVPSRLGSHSPINIDGVCAAIVSGVLAIAVGDVATIGAAVLAVVIDAFALVLGRRVLKELDR